MIASGMDSSGVLKYHERTKHYPERYARGPHSLDWETQPFPFRRYKGAKAIDLPLLSKDPGVDYLAMYTPEGPSPGPFDKGNVAALLELSMGLSAWKGYDGAQWALRMNPSSGNLHPTEAYPVIFCPPGHVGAGAMAPGVYHYAPDAHLLELRCQLDEKSAHGLKTHFGEPGMLVALSSIPWREAWKYGERAFRYCNLDVGHALAALRFSASLQGWKLGLLEDVADEDIARLLGLDKTVYHPLEPEHPDCLVHIYPGDVAGPAKGSVPVPEGLKFTGTPNTLSPEHVEWDEIASAQRLTARPAGVHGTASSAPGQTAPWAPLIESPPSGLEAADVIRRRRSGQAYDHSAGISREAFYAMLDKTLPRSGCAPFDLFTGGADVHIAVFVHRVEGLAQGLYMLIRESNALADLKKALDPGFAWTQAPGAPSTLPLYLLRAEDLRATAAFLSCRQDIAGDGAFSLGMLARFRDNVEARPWSYRTLFWEAGAIGQVLYLEAEAHGVRGTGIGCFYDDTMHAILGLKDDAFQSLYHFTVGKPLEDTRIQTLPPYYHLNR